MLLWETDNEFTNAGARKKIKISELNLLDSVTGDVIQNWTCLRRQPDELQPSTCGPLRSVCKSQKTDGSM